MKKILLLGMIMSNMSCFYLQSDDDIIPESFYSNYEAVTLDRETFEKSTVLTQQQMHETSGRIYVKDNYLIINEPNKGFHIYNNSNPEAPENIGFLNVLGSTNISIKNNVAYINNATDLIAVKINADFNTIEVTKRVKNMFPEKTSPDGFSHNLNEDEVVVDWILKTN